ncbi:MAG: hypothetical protein AAFS10_03005 [Myxococcota bacterium]
MTDTATPNTIARPRLLLTVLLMLLALGCAAWTVSCNSHTVEPFSQNVTAERTDIVTSAGVNKVDILWIVDNSGSMCEEQADLRENFNSFVEKLVEVGADFQLAVITTDMEDAAQSGRFQNVPNDAPGAQCDIIVDISQCPTPDNGQEYPPLIIKSTDPRYLNSDGQPDVQKIQRDFGCSATTGITGTGFEMGLEAARRALSPALIDGGFNAGFLRDDAFLAVIFLTDENDCSDGGALNLTNGNICEWERDKLIPVQEYVDFFTSLKTTATGEPDPSKLIMAGIVAPSDSNTFFDYGEEVEPSCVVADMNGEVVGQGFAGYRYRELLDAFEFSYEDNICRPPFDNALNAISSLIADVVSERCLKATPLTCETDADCEGTCVERGNQKFCESFRIQVEIERPNTEPLPPNFTLAEGDDPQQGECLEIITDEKSIFRCVLVENEQYTIDYASSCLPTGIEILLTSPLSSSDQLALRYPRAVTSVAPTESNGTATESNGTATEGEN